MEYFFLFDRVGASARLRCNTAGELEGEGDGDGDGDGNGDGDGDGDEVDREGDNWTVEWELFN